MTIYRLYTEDVNRKDILSVLNARFEGFTVIPTIGSWRGKLESSLLIELFNTDKQFVIEAASKIASMNHQDAVAIIEADAKLDFATGFIVPSNTSAA